MNCAWVWEKDYAVRFVHVRVMDIVEDMMSLHFLPDFSKLT